jgi:cysteinyl-tRNA synthetase
MATLEWLGFNGDLDRPGEIVITEEVWNKVMQRNLARSEKDFRKADQIRDELAADGIVLQDHPDGTTTPEVKR